jgi:hypothetical protein
MLITQKLRFAAAPGLRPQRARASKGPSLTAFQAEAAWQRLEQSALAPCAAAEIGWAPHSPRIPDSAAGLLESWRGFGPAFTALDERGRQLRWSYFGGCIPRERSHSLRWEPVSACRARRISRSRSMPGGML